MSGERLGEGSRRPPSISHPPLPGPPRDRAELTCAEQQRKRVSYSSFRVRTARTFSSATSCGHSHRQPPPGSSGPPRRAPLPYGCGPAAAALPAARRGRCGGTTVGGQLRPQRRVQQRRVEKQPRCPGAQSRRHPHRGRAGAPLGSARGRAAVALRSARSGRPAGEGSGPAPASPCLAPGVVSPGSAAILRSRPEAAQGAERLRVYLRGQVGAAAARRSSGRAGQERRGVRGERDPPRAGNGCLPAPPRAFGTQPARTGPRRQPPQRASLPPPASPHRTGDRARGGRPPPPSSRCPGVPAAPPQPGPVEAAGCRPRSER